MKPRDLVKQTLRFASPPRIPRQTWILPWAETHFPEDVAWLRERYPDDIAPAPAEYRIPLKTSGDRYASGEYVDEWGCRFSNPQDGIIGIVQQPRIRDWRELRDYESPEEILSLDHERVNDFCRNTDRFVLAGTVQRPFERLQFLRTMEQALTDLMEHPPELLDLLGKIHDLYRREVEVWAETDIDAISLMDDWGTQQGLLAPPEIFRNLFKPMYREYAAIAHSRGKFVFMHSDGNIIDIIPDLIEIGIDALNAQIFCMGVEELGERFRGRMTFWGEIDRQYLLARGSRAEIRQAVERVARHLYAGGGVIAQCEFGLAAKPENILEVMSCWEEFRSL